MDRRTELSFSMGIMARGILQIEFERELERSNPRKIRLVRAKPFNCPNCFINGRLSINELDETCGGTGYVNGVPGTDLTGALYSTTYYIYGDVQTGHGLYGNGGDYLKLIADIGKQAVGDATLFSKMYDRDHVSGNVIYPQCDPSFVRPDRIVSTHGTFFNVVREIIVEVGSDTICRVFTLDTGSFSSQGTGGSR